MIDRVRLNEELSKIREMIRSNPHVLAKFDKDGNGVIDGDEWEQVRQLVIRRLERDAVEAEEAQRLAEEAGEPAAAAEGPASGVVAEEVYESELNDATQGSEMILEQQGGLGQLFEGMTRRSYQIVTRDGSVLGTVQQVENEMLQGLTNKDPFSNPSLSFQVFTHTGDSITLRRSQAMMSDRMEILDGAGGSLGYVTWKPGLLKRRYHVVSTMDRGALTVQSQPFKPFTLQILDEADQPVGSIVRGWSGLGGFLTGGNRLRIAIDGGGMTDGQRWGLLAAALLEDLGSEDRNKDRKGVFSVLGN